MINQEIESVLRYDIAQVFREKFYGEFFNYFDFILPILKKGKHTKANEMECVGSQSLHLYYIQQSKEVTIVVFRHENGLDTVFKIQPECIKIYQSHSENGFEERVQEDERLTEGKKGFTLNVKDIKELKEFTVSYFCDARIKNRTEDVVRKPKVDKKMAKMTLKQKFDYMLKNPSKESSPDALLNIIKFDDKIMCEHDPRTPFLEELQIFNLMNTMLCGVCDNAGVEFPERFFNKEAAQFALKIKKSLKA